MRPALQVDKAGKLTCYHLEVVLDMPPAKVQSLPPDAVIVQFTQIQAPNQVMAAAPDQAAQGGDLTPVGPPDTFLELVVSGQVKIQIVSVLLYLISLCPLGLVSEVGGLGSLLMMLMLIIMYDEANRFASQVDSKERPL